MHVYSTLAEETDIGPVGHRRACRVEPTLVLKVVVQRIPRIRILCQFRHEVSNQMDEVCLSLQVRRTILLRDQVGHDPKRVFA